MSLSYKTVRKFIQWLEDVVFVFAAVGVLVGALLRSPDIPEKHRSCWLVISLMILVRYVPVVFAYWKTYDPDKLPSYFDLLSRKNAR